MGRFKNVAFVSCLISLWYVPAGAASIATTTLFADLSNVSVLLNGGVYTSDPEYEVPLISYMMQQSGLESVEMTVPDGNFQWQDALPGGGASISGFFENGLSEGVAASSVMEGYAYAFLSVGSYRVFEVQDVSSIMFTLDINTSIDLITESDGDLASGLGLSYLDLFIMEETGYSWIGGNSHISEEYAFDGDVLNMDNMHTLDVSYNFSDNFSGRLVLQSTLVSDAYAYSVPEPSGASMMVFGIAALMSIVSFRKKNNRR